MKRLFLTLVTVTAIVSTAFSQTGKASHSQALTTGVIQINLINKINIEVAFSSDEETLLFTGETNDLKMLITENIPLSDPEATGIEIGRSYTLDNMYATIEYKVLKIDYNRVTRIWFRVAAKTVEPPVISWI